MSTLEVSGTKGRPFFEGQSGFSGAAWRLHDDASDSFSGGAYLHNELENSATETNERISTQEWMNEVQRAGQVALNMRNETGGNLSNGTILYSDGTQSNGVFLALLADGDTFSTRGLFVVYEPDYDIPNNNNFVAYAHVYIRNVDTSAFAAIGSPVYTSSTPGEFSATPSTNGRIIGYVTVKNGAVGQFLFIGGGFDASTSGFSGLSGFSGTSGISGATGAGISGASGQSGWSGISGFSGELSGASGSSGTSGVSGFGATGGSLTVTAKTEVEASPYVLNTSTDQGVIFTNTGASAEVHIDLPTVTAGLHYYFAVTDSDGLQVNAAAGDFINIGGGIESIAGGWVVATSIGATLHLVGVDTDRWMTIGSADGTQDWQPDF